MTPKAKTVAPYFPIKHQHKDSLAAFEQAAQMLYTAVTTALSMESAIKDSAARAMLGQLRVQADAFRAAAYGDE